ncbi:RNA polymerase sigma factor (sigma-70 family) [Paenibacillus taihuensis]|uniref:RNA polymerase sigma factor (Sigma-70 family) n=1 Tax=Paenibacillus taihuensis TaxID=1156355 RepID=A0A3D9RWU5_9BACL|nr:sigma-70 family RNA polymerase sigma factor [Paenibacillus taihuensis]REE84469.1 RNA polymerase sigma factor (sigma-70 family) [Paenibacillus taihuensis]
MIAQIRGGDREAYSELVALYRDELYRLIWSVLRDTADAEDTLQEAFVRIYLSLESYRGEGFKTWAARISVNLAIDCKRRNARKAELLQQEAAASALMTADRSHALPAETEALKRDRKRRVRALVGAMPEGYRSIVRSYFLEDRPQKEIAEQEQLQIKSVESKLYRARQWMRKHWKEEDLE